MVWCTPIMHYALCILEQCTSTINHALCTLVHYISIMHCVASYGALPSWTEHLGTMHYNNDSSIVHVITLYFHYALISFLVITSSMHYAPCSLKWWVSLCTVHLRLVHFHCARCTIHLGVVQFHYLPCTIHLVTIHFHHEIWTVHLGKMHFYFVQYGLVWGISTIHLALCTLLRWTSTINNVYYYDAVALFIMYFTLWYGALRSCTIHRASWNDVLP